MADARNFDTIAVSTADSKEAVLAANNSAAWTLDYAKWKDRLRYLVCLRKEGTQRRAFLVCKISAIRLRPDPGDTRPRYSIEFDEFSEAPADAKQIDGTQYPVRFGELARASKQFGFDPARLNFRKAPRKTLDYSYSPRVEETRSAIGIGISEAKRRLAIGLGVREDQIDIIIRA
jgi:hypothetical protein